MRLRNIPGAKDAIAASPLVIHKAEEKRGDWESVFGNANPIRIEIGMGKGRFMMNMAESNPDVNYIGIEMYESVLLRAIQKAERRETPLPNLFFLRENAKNLTEVFADGEVDRIYLNFSDPWPKDRHAKRRLTSEGFLHIYDRILKRDGVIEFKTDNRALFEFSLEEARQVGWIVTEFTYDLHRDTRMCDGNIMTEYEEKFSTLGNPICKMMIKRK